MKEFNFSTITYVHKGYFPYHLEKYFDIERLWNYSDYKAIVIHTKNIDIVVETNDLVVIKPFNRLFIFPKGGAK